MILSRRRGLSLQLCMLAGLSLALPAHAQTGRENAAQLAGVEFNKAYQEKDWSTAIESGLRLDKLAPNNSTTQYNLACVYALNGEPDRAADWLVLAARSGFPELRLFQTDPDLDTIRTHAKYQIALGLVQATQNRARAELERKFEGHLPLILLPSGHDPNRPAPLIIALHGYGGRAEGMAVQWRNVAAWAGAILAVPQAVEPVAGAGFSWNKVDDADVLVQLTLDFVREQRQVDEERVILTGFSQGGFIAFSLGARHPQQYVGVIPMGPPYIAALDAPAKARGDRLPRFYFMCGVHDALLPKSRQAAEEFAAAGYDVEFRVYPYAAHTFPKECDEELRKALTHVLQR